MLIALHSNKQLGRQSRKLEAKPLQIDQIDLNASGRSSLCLKCLTLSKRRACTHLAGAAALARAPCEPTEYIARAYVTLRQDVRTLRQDERASQGPTTYTTVRTLLFTIRCSQVRVPASQHAPHLGDVPKTVAALVMCFVV